jgi:hypothetical protein
LLQLRRQLLGVLEGLPHLPRHLRFELLGQIVLGPGIGPKGSYPR